MRGAQGGYLLARLAGEITVAEIVDALGESITFGDCQTEVGCDQMASCPTFSLWRKVRDSIDEILKATTLEDLVRNRTLFQDEGEEL